jgi:regulatory protein
MPQVTKIAAQRRRPNRRNVYLDGVFAFGCKLNVIARFRLREGMILSNEQVLEIEHGEVRQECFDQAMKFLQKRLHSRAELIAKLNRREYGQAMVISVTDQLVELGYLDDARFALGKARSAAQHKHHGRGRAKIELMKSGVRGATAEKALDEAYSHADSPAVARQLAQKQLPRLRKLDPAVARRRLSGMLARRGFDFETIGPVVKEVLGRGDEMDDSI